MPLRSPQLHTSPQRLSPLLVLNATPKISRADVSEDVDRRDTAMHHPSEPAHSAPPPYSSVSCGVHQNHFTNWPHDCLTALTPLSLLDALWKAKVSPLSFPENPQLCQPPVWSSDTPCWPLLHPNHARPNVSSRVLPLPLCHRECHPLISLSAQSYSSLPGVVSQMHLLHYLSPALGGRSLSLLLCSVPST